MSESNHNKFLSHLRDSHSAVNQVSEWFKTLGYDVNIPILSSDRIHAAIVKCANKAK